MIVYNKTREFAGHTIEIDISAMDTIKMVKEKIMEVTDIPINIQDVTFGGKFMCEIQYSHSNLDFQSRP